jgi:hypothetical protein
MNTCDANNAQHPMMVLDEMVGEVVVSVHR